MAAHMLRFSCAALICIAACGKSKTIAQGPAPVATVPLVPNAVVPDTTDATVATIFRVSHIIAATLELQTLALAQEPDESGAYAISGECDGGGSISGAVEASGRLNLKFNVCADSTLTLRSTGTELYFGSVMSTKAGVAKDKGFFLALDGSGAFALSGDTVGALAYTALDVGVVQNDDGTVTMSLSGDATWGGTATTYTAQSFNFPGAP